MIPRLHAAEGFYRAAGDRLKGGTLHCRRCGMKTKLSPDRAADYLRKGWPKCCGETMELKAKAA